MDDAMGDAQTVPIEISEDQQSPASGADIVAPQAEDRWLGRQESLKQRRAEHISRRAAMNMDGAVDVDDDVDDDASDWVGGLC